MTRSSSATTSRLPRRSTASTSSSRGLLFCFFAEDTGVFPNRSSPTASPRSPRRRVRHRSLPRCPVRRARHAAGQATQRARRISLASATSTASLFSTEASAPTFSSECPVSLVIECGSLNWSVINPDIFGSMMQAVVQPGQRESLGMHYTSVENIMKVIRPLFLDDLQDAFDAADTARAKLTELHERISAIKCLRPRLRFRQLPRHRLQGAAQAGAPNLQASAGGRPEGADQRSSGLADQAGELLRHRDRRLRSRGRDSVALARQAPDERRVPRAIRS